MKRKFPTFAVIVFVAALLWLFSDLGYLKLDIPWIPLIILVISLGWIINNYSK